MSSELQARQDGTRV